MTQLVYKGVVRGKIIRLEEGGVLPEGTEVLVTPLETAKGAPRAVLAAIDAAPHVRPEDVAELLQGIAEGKRPVRFDNPLVPQRKR